LREAVRLAIDGPAGAGKRHHRARRAPAGLLHVTARCIGGGLAAIQKGVSLDDEKRSVALLETTRIVPGMDGVHGRTSVDRMIRTAEAGSASGGAPPALRRNWWPPALLRAPAGAGHGRRTSDVVFPDATAEVFVSA